LWQPVLLFFSFFTVLQQGRKMVRGWWWCCWRFTTRFHSFTDEHIPSMCD
jgi:hypothetical protein